MHGFDTAGMTQCFVALGGNLGDLTATFDDALQELAAQPDIHLGRISSNYATPAVGLQAGGGFLNAVAEIWTSFSPHKLLDRLQQVETLHGRTRETRWGPRTLDLDLIVYGDQVMETAELTVPHRACWYRRFVLDPMAEIAPDALHPVKRATFEELRSRLLLRPLRVALAGRTAERRTMIAKQLAAEFPAAAFDPNWSPADPVPALLAWLGPAEGTAFDTLPLLPRLDVSTASDPLSFLRDVVQAALGP